MPFRKTPLTPKGHLALLRWCIIGVTIYAFCFSLWFTQTQYIYMYFAITGAIYLGGAGAVIIGGLYWRKGTAAGAWSGMITGSVLAVGGIVLDHYWPPVCRMLMNWFGDGGFLAAHAEKFPINGQYVSALAMGSAIAAYIGVSLLTCRQNFNMERLLHRGQYAVDAQGRSAPVPEPPPRTWRQLVGIDENFTRGDRILAGALFCWSMFWFMVFVVVTIWNLPPWGLWQPWPVEWWQRYWFWAGVILPIVLGTFTSIWFTWGGVRDLRRLFARLRVMHADASDDGTVPARLPEVSETEPARV